MSQVDFIIAIVIIIGVISFSIYFVTGHFSTQLDQMNVLELKQSAKLLENKIFENILKDDLNMIKVGFEEIGGYAHKEQIILTVAEDSSKLSQHFTQMYDKDFNLIDLTFDLTLEANQTEQYYIFSSENMTDVSHNVVPNITIRALVQQDYPVVYLGNCDNIDYDIVREEIGHNFKIKAGSCEQGLEPPEVTVVARTVPVILRHELKEPAIEKTFANIMVW